MSYSRVGGEVDQCCGQCKYDCNKCCADGMTDPLVIPAVKKADSKSEMKRDANPNSGVALATLSTGALVTAGLAQAAEMGYMALPTDVQAGLALAGGTATALNLLCTMQKNLPEAANPLQEQNHRAKLFRNANNLDKDGNYRYREDVKCQEKVSAKRVLKSVAVAGTGIAVNVLTGSMFPAIAVAATANCLFQANETRINMKQERPYVNCKEGMGFFSCCACSNCCTTSTDKEVALLKNPVEESPPVSPSVTRA